MSTAVAHLRSVNPATGTEIEGFDIATAGEIDAALEVAARRAPRWAATALDTRAQLLRALAAVLRRDVDSLAAVCTAEMGEARG
jgi:succinate-semialdehyde dehydrogenase